MLVNDELVHRRDRLLEHRIKHAAFLGHGRHYATECCPYYQPHSAPWLLDGVHPNPEGQRAMARQIIARIDALYVACRRS